MKVKDNPLLITSPEYKKWLGCIADRFRQQQIKAAIHINSDKIEFYWSLGRDICEMHVEERWGEGVIKTLSTDLKNILPELAGLTPGGLYYCKRFYLLYSKVFNLFPQVGEQIDAPKIVPQLETQMHIVPQAGEIYKLLHHADKNTSGLPLNIFAIPWGHHKAIIDRFEQEPDKVLFYATKILENSWSRSTLLNMMGDKGKANGLYESQGKAINNFPVTIGLPKGDLARELINDPLNLSFVKLKASYDEDNLKQALIYHVNELLLSLGSGFAYMGKEYLLSVAGKEQFSDLLFYNTRLHAYVVVEVKVTEFESAYLGQLSGYMSLVNHILKDEIDNPTIGLLICKSKNNIFAQYCLEGYSQPIAITAYEGIQILPENFNDSLPSIEELEEEIRNK
ncbi:MAG: PDDEXK nuclease domain-containing protein [Bacteroidales bacterium]|nr:PDDEXK nuclease domain-containing protein [Bacteroidales bacterium]